MSWPSCIRETSDWFGTIPIEENNFETWWNTFWPEHVRKCRNVAENMYVQFKLKKVYVASLTQDMSWEESFENEAFKCGVEQVHAEVGQDSGFFYDICLPRFMKSCRPLFDAAAQ